MASRGLPPVENVGICWDHMIEYHGISCQYPISQIWIRSHSLKKSYVFRLKSQTPVPNQSISVRLDPNLLHPGTKHAGCGSNACTRSMPNIRKNGGIWGHTGDLLNCPRLLQMRTWVVPHMAIPLGIHRVLIFSCRAAALREKTVVQPRSC